MPSITDVQRRDDHHLFEWWAELALHVEGGVEMISTTFGGGKRRRSETRTVGDVGSKHITGWYLWWGRRE